MMVLDQLESFPRSLCLFLYLEYLMVGVRRWGIKKAYFARVRVCVRLIALFILVPV